MEKKHAFAALLALLEEEMGATRLARTVGANPGSGAGILTHLESYGLVALETTPGVAGKGGYIARLTELGHRVAATLKELEENMPPPRPIREPLRRDN